jgi:hypothetical protein
VVARIERTTASQCIASAQCSGKAGAAFAAISGGFCEGGNPDAASRVSTRGTRPAMIPRDSQPPVRASSKSQERHSMHITVAHISPIMSLLAGVLILIMPRLLNLIVAIFLILNGAIGLGLLKWLHL